MPCSSGNMVRQQQRRRRFHKAFHRAFAAAITFKHIGEGPVAHKWQLARQPRHVGQDSRRSGHLQTVSARHYWNGYEDRCATRAGGAPSRDSRWRICSNQDRRSQSPRTALTHGSTRDG